MRGEGPLKDLTLATTAAQSVGVTLPTADLLSEIFANAVEAGPDLDWASIAEVTRLKAAG